VGRGFDVQIGVGGPGPGRSYFAPYTVPEFVQGPDGEYIAERLADEASKLMRERYQNGPFFMHYGEFNVHSPFYAKKELIDYYAKKAESMGAWHTP
jgi:arylsulfatase A-like enzyme